MLWFSQQLWFPSDATIPKFILDQCLAHYVRCRRGYGVPFPEEGKVVFDVCMHAIDAKKSDEILFNAWIPNSPYNADILIPQHRVAVLVLSQFDQSGNPVGLDLLQCEHVKSLGWHVVPVDRSWVRDDIKTVLAPVIARIDS